MNLQGGS
jgi:hypothetical protein